MLPIDFFNTIIYPFNLAMPWILLFGLLIITEILVLNSRAEEWKPRDRTFILFLDMFARIGLMAGSGFILFLSHIRIPYIPLTSIMLLFAFYGLFGCLGIAFIAYFYKDGDYFIHKKHFIFSKFRMLITIIFLLTWMSVFYFILISIRV